MSTGSARAWILAARPATLWAAIAPVMVGSAVAHAVGAFRPLPALGAVLGAIFIQIGTNFANDVFDFEKGADTAERLGPTRAVQAGLLTPRQMRAGMGIAFGLAALCGLYMIYVAGIAMLAIGLVSIAAGIAYTGGPYPLGYLGLGDLFVMLFFGFAAVCGTAYLQAGFVPELAVWASVPEGALATAILTVNNLRDREGDARAGKRTLAVRLGATAARWEYALLLAVSYLALAAILARGLAAPAVLAPVLTLPFALVLARRVLRTDGAALNPCLGATARLLLAFSVLLAAALAAFPA